MHILSGMKNAPWQLCAAGDDDVGTKVDGHKIGTSDCCCLYFYYYCFFFVHWAIDNYNSKN